MGLPGEPGRPNIQCSMILAWVSDPRDHHFGRPLGAPAPLFAQLFSASFFHGIFIDFASVLGAKMVPKARLKSKCVFEDIFAKFGAHF